ncbi:hypothetical protein [Sphingomonas sp. SRS2]|uniref:hypothetical protein n=1 Tax=Sphingomonas sp. SRS2 TaxID=133190 RepID=UPI000618412F|nr:hypothetical protein [Sphingomonas sp. SRS2]KKC25490.1 hypothetical protein WP12_13520 [Sphingomonas sp. SRS2]
MLDILLMSASLAVAPPIAASGDFDVDAAITRHMAVEELDEDRWLPSLIDLPEEEEGARLKLRGRKIKLSMPI